jgi:hypothetical protein
LNADCYLWLFDLAAGVSASAAPREVILCPGGVCTTLDLTSGLPYVNGIYAALSTIKPTDATTQWGGANDAGNNAAILDIGYRLE